MAMLQTKADILVCKYLDEKKGSASPDEHRIIDNLSKHRLNLKSAFCALVARLPAMVSVGDDERPGWQVAIDVIVSSAANFAPEKYAAYRGGSKRAQELTAEIAELAEKLAEKLRTRAEIMAEIGLTKGTLDGLVIDLLDGAVDFANRNRPTPLLYADFVKPVLDKVDALDDRYWPSTADFLEALAEAQDYEKISVHDDIAQAVISTSQKGRDKPSMTDLETDILVALSKSKASGAREALSDEHIAAIVTAANDLAADKAIPRGSIANARKRAAKVLSEMV